VARSGIRPSKPNCLRCGSRMQSTTRSSAGLGGIALTVLLVAAGASAFCLLPGFGFLIGPVLCVLGLVYIGAQRRRVWRCEKCGDYFDPTVSSSAVRRAR
jgi:hypothetical protein